MVLNKTAFFINAKASRIQDRLYQQYERRCDRLTGPRQGPSRMVSDVKITEKLSHLYLGYLRELNKAGIRRDNKGEWVYR